MGSGESVCRRSSLIFFNFNLWLHWVFVAACGLSLAAASRGCALAVVRGLLIAVVFLVVKHRL